MDWSVSTMSLCIVPKECTHLNLYNVYTFGDRFGEGDPLTPASPILGLKYSFEKGVVMCKGSYSDAKRAFYNQVSMALEIDSKKYNVKIFKNGTLQVTGCRDESDHLKILEIVLQLYKGLDGKTVYTDVVTDENGVKFVHGNRMYSEKTNQVFGWGGLHVSASLKLGFTYGESHPSDPPAASGAKSLSNPPAVSLSTKSGSEAPARGSKGGLAVGQPVSASLKQRSSPSSYYVNGTMAKYIDGIFITQKGSLGSEQDMYDSDGVCIGTCKVALEKSLKLFKSKNLVIDYHTDRVTVGEKVIGSVRRMFFDSNRPTAVEKKKSDKSGGQVILSTSPFQGNTSPQSLEFSVKVNCINIVFSLGHEVNRRKLYESLKERGETTSYDPDKYPGVRLIRKQAIEDSEVTYNVTFMIFNSGKVVAIGFKSKECIDECVNKAVSVIKPGLVF